MTKRKGSNSNPVAAGIVDSFVRRSHQVIQLGHDRLVPKDLAELEEPAITGKLVDAIKEALDADDAPRWSKHFWPVDDEPVTVGTKVGKDRPKIDITVYSTSKKPTRLFRFEAKRLSSTTHPAGIYLGEDGMLSLIKGHYGLVEWAGMIGYVQSESCSDWADKIRNAVTTDPKKHLANEPVKFAELGSGELKDVFYAVHAHKNQNCRITHILLMAS
ncbi:MAG: hypothetical protein KF696_12540 [Planctomycetes bacterium]|nr:hypothetical protein [Planctomycetota bacterium]MCW8135917.1 hypothetical protein [Planctomycetota bacterium]